MGNKIKIYQNNLFHDENIEYGFTGRQGGFSETPFNGFNLAFHVGDDQKKVEKNRELLSHTINIDKNRITWASQVHGDNIFILKNEEDIGFIGEYDGIITKLKGIPLMTLYADCIPILLYDPVQNVIGSIHAGWKGTFLEIAGKAVSVMSKEFFSKPEDIKALIGPGICKDHYQVSEELLKDFRNKYPQIVTEGSLNLDLRKINKHILAQKGIEKIFDMEICTSCDNKNFFSFREEDGTTGRFAAFIMLK